MTMDVSGRTKVYGVIGDPIAHSLSPAIHNAAFQALGLDYVYLAFDVATAELPNAIRGMRGLGILGLNVTMPHKQAVIHFLDEVDETADFLSSVNTISNSKGCLRGFCTDGAGAHRALEEGGAELKGKKLVLLGGGGAAKAIAFALAREIAEMVIFTRTPEKNKPLVEALKAKFDRRILIIQLSPRNLQQSLREADVLINATNVGMHPASEQSLIKPEWLKSRLTVMDIIYNPLKTKLANDATKAGANVVSGVEMLIHQGAASFEIWTGRPAPVEVMREAALNQLRMQGDIRD
jgi:shikimate dehydrogenase